MIEKAHKGSPESPNWDGVEDFMGIDESADGSVIDPAAESYQARQLSNKTEVVKQLRLARNERAVFRGGGRVPVIHEEGDGDAGASSSTKPKPKVKAKGGARQKGPEES